MVWTNIRCETAVGALRDYVGPNNTSKMSYKIVANDGDARVCDGGSDPIERPLGVPPAIACQAFSERIQKNLEDKVGCGLVEMSELLPDRKYVSHLLKHDSGKYIAIGKVYGCFYLWMSESDAIPWRSSDLTESDVFVREILDLVSELWVDVVYAER